MDLCSPRRSAAVFLYLLAFMMPVFASDDLEQLVDADHWKKVRAIAEQSVKRNPNDARANYYLSKARENFNEIEDSVAPAEKAIALDGGRPEYHAQAAEVYALMAQRVSLLKQAVYVHRMKRELDAALNLDANNLDALLVQMMFAWKAPAIAGGDRRKADEIISHLKTAHPVWGYLSEAKLYQDLDQARTGRALERAAGLQPVSYLAKVSLAEFYATRANRLADAEKLANECLRLDAGRSAAYRVLARVYAAQGRQRELEELLRTAEQRNPDDLSPYYFAAQELMSHGRDAKQAAQYTRVYLSHPPEGRAPGLEQARQLLASIFKVQAGLDSAVTQAARVVRYAYQFCFPA